MSQSAAIFCASSSLFFSRLVEATFSSRRPRPLALHATEPLTLEANLASEQFRQARATAQGKLLAGTLLGRRVRHEHDARSGFLRAYDRRSDARMRASLVTTPLWTDVEVFGIRPLAGQVEVAHAENADHALSRVRCVGAGYLAMTRAIRAPCSNNPIVVVPRDDLDERVVERDTGLGIEHRRAALAAEVGRDDFSSV